MKLFVVTINICAETEISGIFDSKKKAEEYAEQINGNLVQEFVLNKPEGIE